MWSDARRQIVGRLPRGWHLRSVCEVRGGNQRRPDRLGPVLNRRRSNGHVGPLIAMTSARERLPNRRSSETFSFELSGLHFHRYRLALWFETLRKALKRDAQGRALSPLGEALDHQRGAKPWVLLEGWSWAERCGWALWARSAAAAPLTWRKSARGGRGRGKKIARHRRAKRSRRICEISQRGPNKK